MLLLAGAMAAAAEFAVLSPQTWEAFAPHGKEVDAIYGDYVLRNDKIVAVIAQPLATRNANMTVRNVGGCIIDLTERNAQNDQLSAYYPAGARYPMTAPTAVRLTIDGQPAGSLASAANQRRDHRTGSGRRSRREETSTDGSLRARRRARPTWLSKPSFVIRRTRP